MPFPSFACSRGFSIAPLPSEGQAITTRWGGHEPTLPIPDPRPLGYPERVAGYRVLREGEIPEVDRAGTGSKCAEIYSSVLYATYRPTLLAGSR